MAGIRELLAVGLGVLLGVFLVAFPQVFLRIQLLGRLPRDRGGRYGDQGDAGRWLWLVRGLGALSLLVAGYLAVQQF